MSGAREGEHIQEGCQIILIDRSGRVLLQLRDDTSWISYPNMWALPGGMLESGESPAECIRREVLEELGVELPTAEIEHVMTRARSYGIEHTFTAQAEFDVTDVVLTEGQEIRWFAPDEVAAMHLAYEDDTVLHEFFER